MRPSIKTIFGVGSIALLLFVAFGFFYNYTKAAEVTGTIKTALGSYADLAKSYIPDAPILAVGEYYLWIATSTFTKMGNTLNQMVTQLNTVADQISASAKQYGVNVNISGITNTLFPSTIFYYVFGIIAGFVGGIFLLKKESKFLDAAFAPILPALVIMILFIAASILIDKIIKGQATGAAAAFVPNIALGFMDYLMVFIITYAFILIGTVSAAAVRHVIGARGAQPTAAPATAAKEKKKDEGEEEPEEEKPKAKKQQVGYCSKCKRQNKANAKFCIKCGAKL